MTARTYAFALFAMDVGFFLLGFVAGSCWSM